MKSFVYLLLLGNIFLSFSQFSKTHFIPPIAGSNDQGIQNHFLYISCPSIEPITARITSLGGGFIDVEVSRDNPYTQLIGMTLESQIHVSEINTGLILSDKGYLIEAEDQVYVAVRVIATPQGFQAGGLVSKGQAALGNTFRIGSFVNTGIPNITENHATFISVLATENNTTVNFSDINFGVSFIHDASIGNVVAPVVLDRGQSYVLVVKGPNQANKDGLIGALVSSDKPIAVNCGSFGGTNGNNPNNLDLGFDQIVPVERVGSEYIFVRGKGIDLVERPIIVAHENETSIFVNGSLIPTTTINAGDYFAIDGSFYSSEGNLYVQTSKPVFAYQGLGGTIDQPNQELFFVPPLSCETPRIIDNVPFINQIGNLNYSGTVNLVTEAGSTLNFVINGTNYTLDDLPAFNIQGPTPVVGNNAFESYSFDGLSGNVSVISSSSVYLSYYGSNSASTYGGFYSGFIFKPEIRFETLDATSDNCIPNISLGVNTVTAFDVFQWYFNDAPIPNATQSSFIPQNPGYYFVRATISDCNSVIDSDIIPVSSCATDTDLDGVNDNFDIDLDNDGLTNCDESLGDLALNLTNLNGSTLNLESYSNSFTTEINTVNETAAVANPVVGTNEGVFTIQTSNGETSTLSYVINFLNPVSIQLEYPQIVENQNLLTSGADFIIRSSINQTFTVLNPDDQLLIDTNYDGIYESNVTSYSSFEIRFRLNSNNPLAAGTGTFIFRSHLTESFEIIQQNTTENQNRVSFQIKATCIPIDSDGDGFSNAIDIDSDNDGILDIIEAQGVAFEIIDFADTNFDGLNDAYGDGLLAIDSDTDTIKDYLDLDSDNDGIYDLVEAGHGLSDLNNNGQINGNNINFDTNGFANLLIDDANFGQANYQIFDTDNDETPNYLDLDSDGDACFDVIEAGFNDSNLDGIIGELPTLVDANGKVTNINDGYTNPNNDYAVGAPIEILEQPQSIVVCENGDGFISISTNNVDTIQWESSVDNNTWAPIAEGDIFTGSNTNMLQINAITTNLNNLFIRTSIQKIGNTCGLISDVVQITVNPLPFLNSTITLVQCDDDTDGFTPFNLNQVSELISDNYQNETFTFFTNENAALTNDVAFQIPNPTNFNANSQTIWVRVQSGFECVSVTSFVLNIAVTQIDPTFRLFYFECDDFLDANNDNRDGVTSFNFSNAVQEIQNLLPQNEQFQINFYQNQADAFAETDENGLSLAIQDLTNFRNTSSPDFQSIWVRVESLVGGECFGIGPFIELNVEKLPEIVDQTLAVCDDNNDGFFAFDTANLMETIIGNQTDIDIVFLDENGQFLFNVLPNPFTSNNRTLIVRLTNQVQQNSSAPCFREANINFVVNFSPTVGAVPDFVICDLENNGSFAFDVSNVNDLLINGQTGVQVAYFDANDQALPSPLPNPFITSTQTIRAVVFNTENESCTAETTIDFVVRPTPQFFPDETIFVCKTDGAFITTLQAALFVNNFDLTLSWFRNNELISGADGINLNVFEDGLYEVVATNEFGCENSRFIEVIASEIAQIEQLNIVDLVENASVSIEVSGIGNYVYSLNLGPFQNEPFFGNLNPGIYDVYVKDILNDCGIVSQTFAIIGIPKFFTPNGDGHNDFFEVIGVNNVFNKKSSIYIFDRFGKLLYQVVPGQRGWDGTFNGRVLPATDYWYSIKLEDGRSIKGHFSLIR